MPEQVKHRRNRLIYVRDEHQELWSDVEAVAAALGLPVSAVIASALREYQPVRAWRAARPPVA